ncbi:AsmA family protein [Flavobacterium sp. xlx-214]|uniref:AsmA-like C-terminal region-containing protein n=1 Tax=unclassified Flavobacterium TaxID=196869 RepID=UPI0013D51CBD|nr:MULTISPECIES: AsmA-like C-terminal region-containing protein [unclassified Flavobacterium]MBA5791164.1 AsmA family protein [Flavobacterium sp. xlx-221]QMI83666.1 AsmA family protein [Flavobacterium sp. xlx-214]
MKFKKIGIYIVVALAVLLVFILLAPQLFKKQIEVAVKDVAQEFITTPVNFNNLDISFFKDFPHLTVSLEKLTIDAPKEFGAFKTVETQSVDLGIDVFSLMGKQIKFTQLYVNNGNFNVVTDSLGNFSFGIFKSSDEPSESSSFNLALNKIHIKNTTVLYQDDVSKIKIRTENTNISGDVQVTDKFIDFATNANIQSLFFGLDKSVYVDNKPLKGTINTRVNLDPISVEFKKNELLLADLPLNVLGKVSVLEKSIDFDLNVQSKNASLANLFSLVPSEYQKWYEGMTFTGTSNIQLLLKGKMEDQVSKPNLNIDVSIANGQIAATQFKNNAVKNLNTKVAVHLPQLNPDSLAISVPNFDFKLNDGFANGTALYKAPMYVKANVDAQLNVTQLWQTLAISGMQLKGDVVLNGVVDGFYLTKEVTTKKGNKVTEIVEIPTFNVDANWKDGYFQWNEMPMPIDYLSFNLTAKNTSGNYKQTAVNVQNLDTKAGNNYVKGAFKVDNLIDYNLDANVQAFVNLADVKKIFPIKEVDFGGELTVNTQAKGKLDINKQRIPVTKSIVKLKNGFLKYNSLPELPLEKINLETHIQSARGSFNDLKVNVLPVSFVLANEPFHLDASMFNFNNLTFDIGTKGTLNLNNIYKVFAVDGWDVDGKLVADLKLKGKGGGDDPSSVRNRGFVLMKDIHIKSDYFPHSFIFKEGTFRFYKNKMKLENIKMNYAKQTFVLNGDLENYINYFLTPKATLKGNLNVTSQFVDVNSFMAGNTVSSSATNPTAKSNASGVVLVPDLINFELSANLQKVKFNDLLLNDLSGVLKVYDKKLALHQAKFGLIDAPFLFNGTYQPVSTKKALFTFDVSADHFDIQRAYKEITLFREMASAAENASGQVSLKYQLEGSLNQEMYPNMKSIKGAGDLILENIQFKGFKLFNAVAKESKVDALNDANVKNVTVKTAIANNVMTIERTKFKILGFRPRVEGQVTLDGRMNIGMRLGLPPFGIIGIPITIKGTSDDMNIKLGKYKEEALSEDDDDYDAYKKTLDTVVEENR